ncbi:MAG: 1-acyl-sn-glycerol-3-phosphate acyltransferase [Chloroflexota bacterium]|nr:1-acyl-sn-glycerol-3-phosphate acyltransferase [Chloroflexota bacterium]
MKRDNLQRLVRFLIKHLTHTQFFDVENIPTSGGVIIATNHLNYMDTPVLFANPRRPDITALITTKYEKNLFMRWFAQSAQAIWIDRDVADFTAIRKASKVLGEGWALGIAPEGTRSKTAQLQEGKPGTIMLAAKAKVPIVPVGIAGTEHSIKDIFHFKRPKITVRFGPAFTIPEFNPGDRSAELKHWTDEMMRRIAVLLPEQYRGVYADQVT